MSATLLCIPASYAPFTSATMRHTLSALTPLFASFALLVLGHGLLGTLLAVRMTVVGFSAQAIGVVAACYSVGFVVGTRLDGHAIRNVRHIRTFAALSAIAASATLAFALLINPLFWAVMRLLYGGCLAGLYMVMESWLNANTPWHLRGKILGVYSMITYLGIGGGQFLLLCASPRGITLFLLVAILISLSLVPLALARVSSPELPEIRPVRLHELYRLQPCGLAGALSSGVIIGSFLGFGPVFAKYSGFSDPEIAWFMGLTITGGFLLQWPIGILSDRYSRRAVISVVALCVAIQSVAIAWSADLGAGPVIALSVLWGAFAFTLYPVSVALINDHMEASQFVAASAGLLFTNSLGMIAGNLMAGQVVAVLGARSLFGIAAVTALALAVYSRVERGIVRSAQGVTEPVRYQPLPRNSPYASILDPRGEASLQLELEFDHLKTSAPEASAPVVAVPVDRVQPQS